MEKAYPTSCWHEALYIRTGCRSSWTTHSSLITLWRASQRSVRFRHEGTILSLRLSKSVRFSIEISSIFGGIFFAVLQVSVVLICVVSTVVSLPVPQSSLDHLIIPYDDTPFEYGPFSSDQSEFKDEPTVREILNFCHIDLFIHFVILLPNRTGHN